MTCLHGFTVSVIMCADRIGYRVTSIVVSWRANSSWAGVLDPCAPHPTRALLPRALHRWPLRLCVPCRAPARAPRPERRAGGGAGFLESENALELEGVKGTKRKLGELPQVLRSLPYFELNVYSVHVTAKVHRESWSAAATVFKDCVICHAEEVARNGRGGNTCSAGACKRDYAAARAGDQQRLALTVRCCSTLKPDGMSVHEIEEPASLAATQLKCPRRSARMAPASPTSRSSDPGTFLEATMTTARG